MSYNDLSEKDKVRLILKHVMGCWVTDVTAQGYHSPELPKGRELAALGFHWPLAYWNTDGEGWMIKDIATDADFFDPLHDLNDTWLIMDTIKPGRNNDPGTFLTRANFVSYLDNNMIGWWSYTKERLCSEICKNALKAYGVLDVNGNVIEANE